MIGKDNAQNEVPDFDRLMTLYQQDPDEFEALRRHLLNEALETAPEQHRPMLETVLVRIERARNAAATPMESVIAASRMMHESAASLALAWSKAQYQVAGMHVVLLMERLRA